jgi:CubicO group peptidase (beta-lactamase class C family)
MSTIEELRTAVRADVDSGRLPACQFAVARDGELLAFESFGQATNDSRFCVFSATKPIVASAIWLLLGEGRLALDDQIASHIPEFGTNGKDVVTLEQVLLHTSGFPMAPIAPLEGATPEGRAARFAQWRLDWEPGSRFEYHPTSAHYVLIDLLERIEGRDFRRVIEDRVSRPLGLPRLLGLELDDQADIAHCVVYGTAVETTTMGHLTDPDAVAAGVPGGGGVMTAASLALFYQGLLHNPGGLWDDDVLTDATTNVLCTFPEPLFDLPVNRTIGLVLAGDDGKHFMRYAGFGPSCSPRSFGHAGAFMQIGWADPESGISFAYCHNGLYDDMMTDGARGVMLADLAASIT